MAEQPETRQELYDRIRSSSKDEVVLEEMIRYGFWPAAGQIPQDPADDVRRLGELVREAGELRSQDRRLKNETALLKEFRKRRLAESKAKQQETKARREAEGLARANAWRERQGKELLHVGAGVSAGLRGAETNEARLQANGLPLLRTPLEVAMAMGITLPQLTFLVYARKVSEVSHYVRFTIPKKTGGERVISAPMKRLKTAQTWLLRKVLDKLQPGEPAHGFRPGRSIVSNARPHVGADVVINVDLKDFFPSISYPRVKGLFVAMGYSEAVATVLGLLSTEPDVEKVLLDGKTWYVAVSGRHVPQGAPSSPAITNLLCRRLDRRLTKLADKHGFVYTRYGDDLTLSGRGDKVQNVCNVLRGIESIVKHEGFTINTEKNRVLRKSRQQEVTGVVVNARLNVARATLRRFRAVLYQIDKDGPAGKHWGPADDVLASVRGFANFVNMVDPQRGALLRAQVKRIMEKHNWKPKARPVKAMPPAVPAPPPAPAPPRPAKKPWWKFW